MEIFSIIVFGLLVVQTLKPFSNRETYKKLPDVLASLIIFVCGLVAYIWFLRMVIDKF